MSANAYGSYLEGLVSSASPLELITLLYEAALAEVREARRMLAAGEIRRRSKAIDKAGAIVAELTASLDRSRGAELCGRLAALYVYVSERLIEANFQQDDRALAEVESVLETLSQGWREISAPVRQDDLAESARMGYGGGTFDTSADAGAHAWSF